MTSRTRKIDEGLLTLEDVALVLSESREVPAGTAHRLAGVVLSDPRFEPHVQRLDALAEEADLPEAQDRPLSALHCERSFERLAAAAAEDWYHPAEVLDPEGDLGIAYRELVQLAHARATQPGAPLHYGVVLVRLEQAWAEEKKRAELVERFVGALLGYEPEAAQKLLRLASAEYRLRARDAGR